MLIIGSVGLLLTHTVMTMYIAILCFLYVLTQSKKLRRKQLRNTILFSIMIILMLTSFFWVPLLEHKSLVNYEVFKTGRMERTNVLIAFKLNLSQLLVTPANQIWIYEIGLLSVVLLAISPIVIQKLKKKWRHTDFYRFYLFSLFSGIICLIMTLKIFPFEHLPSILKMLQFSYRLLEFSSFFFAFVVAVNVNVVIKNIKYGDIVFILVVLMLLTVPFKSHLPYTDKLDEERLIQTVPVTSRTGRIHAGCATFEYLPSKAFEHRYYLETRSQDVIVLEGEAQIEEQKKENTNLMVSMFNVKQGTKIELPYIYYLGYEAMIKQGEEEITLETYETENGFVGVIVPTLEEGTLQVHYEGSIGMKVSAWISVLGLVVLLGKAVFCTYV